MDLQKAKCWAEPMVIANWKLKYQISYVQESSTVHWQEAAFSIVEGEWIEMKVKVKKK